MEKSRTRFMIISMSVIIAASTLYFVFSEGIDAQLEEKVFVTHTGAIVKTTGEIIDPLYVASTMEFDPMEYLREFNYGRVSQLPDGTTLREFTIIAEDDKVMEI